MPIYLRVIHRDDPATLEAALSPSNALAGVPEVARVWYDPSAGSLVPVQPPDLFWETVRKTRIVFNSDLFKSGIPIRRDLIPQLARVVDAHGVNPANVTLITDWEAWGPLGRRKSDFDFWYRSVSEWPGPIGNYGNAEGKHVEAHPGNGVALSWPWLRSIPNARGVSCPSAYNLGLSVTGMRKTIAVARSHRFYFWGKPRQTVAFIADPLYHADQMIGYQREYLEAAQAADYIVLWPISRRYDGAKYPNFTGEDRLRQDALTAANLGRITRS